MRRWTDRYVLFSCLTDMLGVQSLSVINVKKLWCIHELTAHYTSKTAKITKRWLPTSTSPNNSFFTFIFAVLLRFCSCSVTLFRVRSTWYGVRGGPRTPYHVLRTLNRVTLQLQKLHHFWSAPVAQQPLPTKFGIKGVTASYYSSDCKNSLYCRTSRDQVQPYKLLYKLMSSALFRKSWCI